jgi:hypothetical protein
MDKKSDKLFSREKLQGKLGGWDAAFVYIQMENRNR